MRYDVSPACWSYDKPVSEVGYKSLNLTSNTGLFLLDNIVNVASEYWAPTSQPTSSVIQIVTGASADNLNGSSMSYIAYCFSEVTGYSKFGYYIGIGKSAEDGKFLVGTNQDFRQVGLVRDPLQSANANAFFTAPLADQSVKLSLTDVTSFQEDETVKMPQIYQGNGLANSSANGVLIDLKNNVMRLNRIQGDFTSNSTVNTITGATSGGTATIITNGVSDPDMKPYSGDILYIENRKPVVRLDDQVEDFKIVLEF